MIPTLYLDIKNHFRLTKKNGFVLILAPRPSIFYKTTRKLYEYYKREWIFGYENPLETKKVIEMIKENTSRILKTRNFIFSMGCLAQKSR